MVFDKHPAIAPYVFVTPTATMLIRQGRHVDANGKVYLPYLSDWKKGRSDLKGLAEIMCTGKHTSKESLLKTWLLLYILVFGSDPPVAAKPVAKIKGKFNKSMFYFYIHSTVWCVETSVLTVISPC